MPQAELYALHNKLTKKIGRRLLRNIYRVVKKDFFSSKIAPNKSSNAEL